MKHVSSFFRILKKAALAFIEDNGFKLSASLSYYTVFSIGPILIIIISLVGIFLGRDAVQGRVYEQVKGFIGSSAAVQLQEIIKNIEYSQFKTTGLVIGIIMLLFGASGVFTEIQDSVNRIWSIKAKPQKGWLKFIINRLLSFSLVVGMGFIMLVSLLISTALDALSGFLQRFFSEDIIVLFYILNIIIVIAVITVLFAIIFKVLPDATIHWRDVIKGSLFTAILFMGGKFLISFYISRSNVGVTYGAAATIVIILLWVYYSSVILYFGAEYTKCYAVEAGSGIKPKDTAVFVVKQEAKEIPPSYLDT
ncbi:YihY/virulence factor BrkB family protein [Paraflavitalea sp. CAU 1676]|uniref:YihY/virulence factor BrkB family protein n=1 Tax=Paraflavitalea sp. CAU 1676 TaxID=3032598 RepID=UPI0023D98C64|nr:YihY/virulence factor BrkB family protein [Paraflavitalea sp. CAU 1676]MDF2190294.1 YihY/virulence factor BrkB family protein [Paraflavitalea sp. CAU 1676]